MRCGYSFGCAEGGIVGKRTRLGRGQRGLDTRGSVSRNCRYRSDDVGNSSGGNFFSFFVRLRCNEFPASRVERDHVRCVKERNHLALLFFRGRSKFITSNEMLAFSLLSFYKGSMTALAFANLLYVTLHCFSPV